MENSDSLITMSAYELVERCLGISGSFLERESRQLTAHMIRTIGIELDVLEAFGVEFTWRDVLNVIERIYPNTQTVLLLQVIKTVKEKTDFASSPRE